MVLDYVIAAVSVGLIAGLSWLNSLPPALLLVIVGLSSLTNPLSTAGARSLFPILVPRELWERANGLDSGGHVIATLVGAPLAGALVGWIGGEWALAIAGVLFIGAALVMIGLPDPSTATDTHGHVLRNAWLGLKYVAQNPSLRGLALTLSFLNFGWGVMDIAVPVLVLGRLHQGPATVGYLWGALGRRGPCVRARCRQGADPGEGAPDHAWGHRRHRGGDGLASLCDQRGCRRDRPHFRGHLQWTFRYQPFHAATAPYRSCVVRPGLRGVDVSQLRRHPDRLGASRTADRTLA